MKKYSKLMYLLSIILMVFSLASCKEEIEDDEDDTIIINYVESGETIPLGIFDWIYSSRVKSDIVENDVLTITLNYGFSDDYFNTSDIENPSPYYEYFNSLDEYSDYNQELKLTVYRVNKIVTDSKTYSEKKEIYSETNTLRHYLSEDFKWDKNELVDSIKASELDTNVENEKYAFFDYYFKLSPVNDDDIKLFEKIDDKLYSGFTLSEHLSSISNQIGTVFYKIKNGDEIVILKPIFKPITEENITY